MTILSGIPEDVFRLIFRFLPSDNDIYSFSLVCRHFCEIANDPHNLACNVIERFSEGHALSYILSNHSKIKVSINLIEILLIKGAMLSRYTAQCIQDGFIYNGKKFLDEIVEERILSHAKEKYGSWDENNDWTFVSQRLEAYHQPFPLEMIDFIRYNHPGTDGETFPLEKLPLCRGMSEGFSEFLIANNFFLSPFFELSPRSTRPTTFTRTLIMITRNCPSVLDGLVDKGWHLRWLDQADFFVRLGRHHKDMKMRGEFIADIGSVGLTLLRKNIISFTPATVRRLLALASKEMMEPSDDIVAKNMLDLLGCVEARMGFTVASVAREIFKEAIEGKDFGSSYAWRKLADTYACDDIIKETVLRIFKVTDFNTSDPPPLPQMATSFFDWLLDRYQVHGVIPQTLLDSCILNFVILKVSESELYNIHGRFSIVLNLFRTILSKGIRLRSKHVEVFKKKATDRFVMAMFLEAVWEHGVWVQVEGKTKKRAGKELMIEWLEADNEGASDEEQRNAVFYDTLKGVVMTKRLRELGRR